MATASPERDRVATVMDAVRRIVQALRRSSRQSEQALGLSSAQLFVLQRLADVDAPISLGELAQRTLTDPSSVSTVVSRLEERGFVLRARSTTDGRRIELRLAARGRAFLEKRALVTAQERLAAAVAALRPGKQELLATLLTDVINAAGFADGDIDMFFEDDDAGKSAQGRKDP